MSHTRRIQVDLNRRNRAGQVVAPYHGKTPAVGEAMVAFEPEDGVRASATVAAVDVDRCVVALDVDWSSMVDDHPHPAALVLTSASWNVHVSPGPDDAEATSGSLGGSMDGESLVYA